MPKDPFKNYYLVKDTRADNHMRKTFLGSIVLCLALVGTFTAGRYSASSGRELDIKGNNGRNLLAAASSSSGMSSHRVGGKGGTGDTGDYTPKLNGFNFASNPIKKCMLTFKKDVDGTYASSDIYDCFIVGVRKGDQVTIPTTKSTPIVIDTQSALISSIDVDNGQYSIKGEQLLVMNPNGQKPKGAKQDAKFFYVLQSDNEQLFFKNGIPTELAKALQKSDFLATNVIIDIDPEFRISNDKTAQNIDQQIQNAGYNMHFFLEDTILRIQEIITPTIEPEDTIVIRLDKINEKINECTEKCTDREGMITEELTEVGKSIANLKPREENIAHLYKELDENIKVWDGESQKELKIQYQKDRYVADTQSIFNEGVKPAYNTFKDAIGRLEEGLEHVNGILVNIDQKGIKNLEQLCQTEKGFGDRKGALTAQITQQTTATNDMKKRVEELKELLTKVETEIDRIQKYIKQRDLTLKSETGQSQQNPNQT